MLKLTDIKSYIQIKSARSIRRLLILISIVSIFTKVAYTQDLTTIQIEPQTYEELLQKAKSLIDAGKREEATRNLLKAIDILEKSVNKLKLADVYALVADNYAKMDAPEIAARYYIKSIETGYAADKLILAVREENLGDIQNLIFQFENALLSYYNSCSYYLKINDKTSLIRLYGKITSTSRQAEKYEESLNVNSRLLQLAEDKKDSLLLFNVHNNMGYDYVRINMLENAIESFQNAFQTGITAKVHPDDLARVSINVSICQYNLNKPREAIANLRKLLTEYGIEMSPVLKSKTENLIATIFLNTGDLYNAGRFSQNAIESALISGDKYILFNSYHTHSKILKAGNDHILALEYYEKYLNIRDSLLLEEKITGQEKTKRKLDLEKSEKEIRLEIADENIYEMRLRQSELERQRQRQQIDSLEQATILAGLQFESEKQAAALDREILERELAERANQELINQNKIQELEIVNRKKEEQQKQLEITRLETINRQQKIVNRRTVYMVILLVLVAISILGGLITMRRKNRLLAKQKSEIEEKNYHLEQLNEEINTQKEMIQEKNTAITDSIRYAEKIQSAVLPPQNFFKENLEDYFILFRPRDIVSGDFYWGNSKDGRLVIVAADCTGHGVPGAFMSMLGTAFLNEIVNSLLTPESDVILNRLRQHVIEALRQTGDEGEAKDGMDIALCVMDYKKMSMQFSGAFNPLYYIKNNELLQIKADRMPIGIHPKIDNGFTRNELKINKGDVFYIFSDGYADQFGGHDGKKFKNNAFQELLLSNHTKPMSKQKQILEETFDSWKKGYDQIDDMLVIGVRV